MSTRKRKNDLGPYWNVDTRIWKDPVFTALSPGERVFALYLAVGPQAKVGPYRLSLATAAEDLARPQHELSERLAAVCRAFEWLFDPRTCVLTIRNCWFVRERATP